MMSKTFCEWGDPSRKRHAAEIKMYTYAVVCELYAGHHQDASVASLPIVVADKRTLAGGALAFGNACHAEANVFRLVEGSGIKDGDTVPAGLDLDG
jgi:hypothetical protein